MSTSPPRFWNTWRGVPYDKAIPARLFCRALFPILRTSGFTSFSVFGRSTLPVGARGRACRVLLAALHLSVSVSEGMDLINSRQGCFELLIFSSRVPRGCSAFKVPRLRWSGPCGNPKLHSVYGLLADNWHSVDVELSHPQPPIS